MEKLQERLKTLRHKMSWSQEDLAREIYVSLATVQRWESGNVRRPSKLARKELSRLFKKAGIDSN